jgi:hypothetical protein
LARFLGLASWYLGFHPQFRQQVYPQHYLAILLISIQMHLGCDTSLVDFFPDIVSVRGDYLSLSLTRALTIFVSSRSISELSSILSTLSSTRPTVNDLQLAYKPL